MNGSDPRQFGEIIFLKAGMRTPWCSLRYTKAGDWGKGSLCFSVVEAALEEHKWTDGFVHQNCVRTRANLSCPISLEKSLCLLSYLLVEPQATMPNNTCL